MWIPDKIITRLDKADDLRVDGKKLDTNVKLGRNYIFNRNF
jgi:hypothetical protein